MRVGRCSAYKRVTARHRFVWAQTEYSTDASAPTSLTPSSKFVKFFAYVDELESTLRSTAGERAASAVRVLSPPARV